MRAKRAKKLKFSIPIWKRGLWVWTVVKNGVIGCKICVKKWGLIVYWQADDIGWNKGVSQDSFPLQAWRAAQELIVGSMRPVGRRLPTPALYNVWLPVPIWQLSSDQFCDQEYGGHKSASFCTKMLWNEWLTLIATFLLCNSIKACLI